VTMGSGLAADFVRAEGSQTPFFKSAHRTWQHAFQNSVAVDEVMIERRADVGQNQ
jgi:hypothetical protein